MSRSQELFKRANAVIPGGVNSPVRSFSATRDYPPFIAKGDGAYIYDEDGNKYVDLVCSWGPLILGHNHPVIQSAVSDAVQNGLGFGAATKGEVELAELITEVVDSVDKLRLTCSGTEAVMTAIRLARAYTGREKIIKFDGCYHGHSDAMLVSAGSGVLTREIETETCEGENVSRPGCGVTIGASKDTLIAKFNDIESVRNIFAANHNEVAAVIVELVPANMGVVLPKDNFLANLQNLCRENGALLIADEVITGFRIGMGGAQKLYGIRPDITTFGKVIGGGLPVGAIGSRKEIMDILAPVGEVYQAGTLSGNPIAVAAGLAQLKYLLKSDDVYSQIEENTKTLAAGLTRLIDESGRIATVNFVGSLMTVFHGTTEVTSFSEAKNADIDAFKLWHSLMLDHGIYLAPSQFEAAFVSAAITENEIKLILDAAEKSLDTLSKCRR